MPVARPSSIGTQLVLRFTLASAILFSCALGALYFLVVRHAINEDNAVLANKLAELREEMRHADRVALLGTELQADWPHAEMAFLIRVFDRTGNVLAETPEMREKLPPELFPGASEGQVQNLRREGQLFSLATTEVTDFVIQVGQDRSDDEEFRRRFGWLLLGVLVIAVAASAAIALPVTRHSLQPLREMTRAVERTDEAHLSEKVGPESWPAELRPLAVAFDRMLDRLNDSFCRLSQFSADLAHELRTPIANMMGEAQVALTRARTSEEYRGVIESTVVECERVSGIVESLLFLARAETGGQKMQPTKFDGGAALEKIAGYFQPAAEEKNVVLSVTGKAEVFADAVLFERAVSNLIDNALQHVKEQGKISLSLSQRNDGGSVVAAADTGAGIAAEHLPKVFDRFYRADVSRSVHGSGLGLALVKSIMELHRGQATIASEPGRGTTVTLIFPGRENKLTKL